MRKPYNFFTRCCLYDAPLLRKKCELVAQTLCETGKGPSEAIRQESTISSRRSLHGCEPLKVF